MAKSIITFDIIDGKREEFLKTFGEAAILEIASFQDGYEGGELLVSVDDPNAAAVVADWRSSESYSGWLHNPERERTGELLRPFLAQDPVGQIFDVVHSVLPRTAH